MARIRNEGNVEKWLNAQPEGQRRMAAVLLASRSALRVLPFVLEAVRYPPQGWERTRVLADIVLPVVRAAATPWFVAYAPSLGAEIAVAARAAARAAAAAARAAARATAVARATAAAARATAGGAAAAAYAAAASARANAYAGAFAAEDASVYAAAMWRQIAADVAAFEGRGAAALAALPLLSASKDGDGDGSEDDAGQGPSHILSTDWNELAQALGGEDGDFGPYVRWYEDVCDGWIRADTDALARATYERLGAETKQDGLKVIDALIRGVMGESAPDIPGHSAAPIRVAGGTASQ